MSDIMTKKPARTVVGMNTTNAYRGWRLVNTSQNWWCACKGSKRVSVGAMRHGDTNELVARFRKKVDEIEGAE